MAKQTVDNKRLMPYRFIGSLLLISAISIGMLLTRIADSDSGRYSFLIWNLVLAAVPPALAWWLADRIRQYGWLKWQQVALSLLWLVFLPNSFYLVTDLIHLQSNFEADLLFGITILMSFIMAGLIFGFLSVFYIHREIVKRLGEGYSYLIVGAIFLLVSFAVCLGRYTRWNTWDILLRPAGLLFDVSDRLINPTIHLQTYQTTLTLFLLLFSSYIVVWEAARLMRAK